MTPSKIRKRRHSFCQSFDIKSLKWEGTVSSLDPWLYLWPLEGSAAQGESFSTVDLYPWALPLCTFSLQVTGAASQMSVDRDLWWKQEARYVLVSGHSDQKTPRFLCPVWKNPGRTLWCNKGNSELYYRCVGWGVNHRSGLRQLGWRNSGQDKGRISVLRCFYAINNLPRWGKILLVPEQQ